MSRWLVLLRREVILAFTQSVLLPMLFFVLVATLYPFAIGPNSALLAQTGGGVLWIAALLAALLPLDRLIVPDRENGVLDQLLVRGISAEAIILAKWIAHWLSFAPLLMLAVFPAAALLNLDAEAVRTLLIGLAIGTPALAALGVMIASLTMALPRAGALAGLLMVPLALPILIFGAGALSGAGGALKLLAASSLFLCAITPYAAGAALRAGQE